LRGERPFGLVLTPWLAYYSFLSRLTLLPSKELLRYLYRNIRHMDTFLCVFSFFTSMRIPRHIPCSNFLLAPYRSKGILLHHIRIDSLLFSPILPIAWCYISLCPLPAFSVYRHFVSHQISRNRLSDSL